MDAWHDCGPEKQRIFTAECAEEAEKKMALINYMKLRFSEPAPDPDLRISAPHTEFRFHRKGLT